MKNKALKHLAIYAAAAMIGASLFGCGNSGTAVEKKEVVSTSSSIESSSEKETLELTAEDVDLFLDGIEDINVLLNTKEFAPTALILMDGQIIKGVQVDTSNVDYSKEGTYTVTYTVVIDEEGCRNYLADMEGYEPSFKEVRELVEIPKDATTVFFTKTITVVTQEKAEELAKSNIPVYTDGGKLAVDTVTDTADTVEEANKKAEEKAETKAEETRNETKADTSTRTDTSGSTSKTNTGSNSGSANKGNTGNTSNTNKGNTGSSSSTNKTTPTPAAHSHSYTASVTKAATCASAGVKTYTCSCGASYTESIPANGSHNWVAQSSQVYVVDANAYEEPIYTTEEKLKCGCGEIFSTASELNAHQDYYIDLEDYSHGSYSVIWNQIQTGTVHHDEVGHYETVVTGHVCSVCGATM